MSPTTFPLMARAVVVALVLLGAACGSDDGSSTTATTVEPAESDAVMLDDGEPDVLQGEEASEQRAWMDAAAELCERDARTLPEPPAERSPQSLREVLPAVAEVLAVHREGFEQLAAPPHFGVNGYDDYLISLDELDVLVGEALDAAERGDAGELRGRLAAMEPAVSRLAVHVRGMGLDRCLPDLVGSSGGDDFEPFALGDDVELDALWVSCEQGTLADCDLLRAEAPVGSAYADHARRCGGRFGAGRAPASCVGSPDAEVDTAGPGDDPHLDALWADCADGDGVACDELYWGSTPGSEYEAFGTTCGGRFDPDDVPLTCEVIDEDS
jgi:hypothetical protein